MRKLRHLVWFACLASASVSLAQKEDWLPVTQQDQQVKEVPGVPGAKAIQLYYAHYIDDNNHSQFFYNRIKILTEAGKDVRGYADVEIPVLPFFSVNNLKARTIHPDGTIVEFTGKPFEKTIIKGKGFKFLAKTFSMPEVTVGSIVEYKYRIEPPEGSIYDGEWTIQHELFTVKENFTFRGYEGGLQGTRGGTQVSYAGSNLTKRPTQKGNQIELEMENVPAFESEATMPPEENYKPHVRFFYGGGELASPERFWQDMGTARNDLVERFIGNRGPVRDAATAAIGGETDPERKLRKLYARAQQIRNLSYERERDEQEQKKEQLKPNQNTGDVLDRGFGSANDITLLFVAMARAAGFDTAVVLVSSRQEQFFEKNFLSARQLSYMVADVQVGGKDLYLDPGTRFCPFGLVRWMRTSTAALKLDKKGGTFIQLPPAANDKAVISRTVKAVLSEDGSITGDGTVQYQGGEALEHRLDAIKTDDAGRKKQLEDELKSWLPNGIIVKITDAQGWESTDDPLVAHFTLSVTNYGSVAGKRLLLPSALFQAKQKDAFKIAQRKYPVYFPYAFAEIDRISVKLPAGYSMENLPQPQSVALPYALYRSAAQFTGSELVTERVLRVNGILFYPNQYSEVKDFFNKVQAGDEQQAVLRVGGNVNAQKGN